MKQLFFLMILFFVCFAAMGQTGKLAGLVKDAQTGAPLELATVSIMGQDSGLVAYQLSDKNGKFMFNTLPLKKKLRVSITYTGYAGYAGAIELAEGKTDTLHVSLALSEHDSAGVVVTATIPIRMNGDTLEINPAAFKMNPDAVVEELLNQVPGVTIWSDGSITMNGKKVQNLFVDGKPFLGASDPRIATQNLPKTAIDKIQLYQEYDRSNIGQQRQPQDSVLTMNIKLKEGGKKGYFGKAGAGLGTTDRFESDLSFQVYNKKSSIGIGGGFNNINKNIGSLQELFQNNTYRNYNPNLYSVGRFGNSGISRNHSIGGLFTHNFIETTNSRQTNRLAVNYNRTGTNVFVSEQELEQRTTVANPQLIRSDGEQTNRNNSHDVGINYVRTNSYNDNLNINGTFNSGTGSGRATHFTEVRDTANQLQSTNASTALQTQRSDNAALNVNFAKADQDNPLKGFNLQLNAQRGNTSSERDVQTAFQSFTDASQNAVRNRVYATNGQNTAIGGTLDYNGFKRLLLGRHNLFGIQLSLSQFANYSRLADQNVVSDYDSSAKRYVQNSSLSNRNRRELFEYAPALVFSKGFSKWGASGGRFINVQGKILEDIKRETNESSLAKRNLVRTFSFFRYEGHLSYQKFRQESHQYVVFLNYRRHFDYPSIDQLFTIVDDVNAYDIRVGNPLLQNQVNDNLSINANFNTQKPKSVYSINTQVNGGYNFTANAIADSIINDPSGKRITYYINADRRTNLYLAYNFAISRRLDKNMLQLLLDGNYNTGKMPNYIDGLYNTSQTVGHFNQYRLQFTLRSLLVLNLGQSFQYNGTRQTAGALSPFKNRNTATKLGVVLNYPQNFSLSSTFDHIANSNLNKPTMLWNAFATYRFMKQQGELKLSAMDILKQYKNILNSAGPYGTTTRVTNGLQQYFMLTFSYYPRKFGKTEIKRQEAD